MKRTSTLVPGLVGLALVLTACSQGGGGSTTEPSAPGDQGTVEEASGEAPAPFDGDVKVAIVQQSGQGDYFQQYLNGTRQQAEALGIELSTFDAQGDNATQASHLEQAIASGVDGIIVRHGFPDTLCPGVNKAIEQGIDVIIYDVEIQQCAPEAVQTQQSDALMASLVLDRMLEDVGEGADVGYVNVAGIAPLDRRDVVWRESLAKNGWNELFKTGAFTNSTATDSAPMIVSSVQSNASIKAIYSPYDEFAKGTLSALEQAGRKDVLVYGADISTADIELMVAEGSPWVATGATDPNAIGAVVMRTLALHMAGELDSMLVEFPPILVTQEFLREEGITNMETLRAAQPELNISDVSSADWIPVVEF
ncbi:substrate-binding domain-containing protein [Cellulomonas fengjieae]|uniref:substrate-binding domain-containing protein n=1 Tax=Cellulomonas fengjieae TaxID=2819978 RepID=UPI001AAF300A|nr:substrate-binding domain-containing protein [Cellulomonas fengjieae]MBO3102185.1 substrate-binding domain-containing protein [Cellulomonas fengjieae]